MPISLAIDYHVGTTFRCLDSGFDWVVAVEQGGLPMRSIRLAGTTLVSTICWLGIAASCCNLAQSEENSAAEPKAVSFESDIQPLLKEKCGKCHGPNVQKSELALHTAAMIQKGGESGAVIIAGNSAESRLFEMVKQGEMPPDQQGTLTGAELELIRRWIDDGASFGKGSADPAREITQHDVVPILLLRCTICHGRHKQEGGLDLRNRESMIRGGKSGPAFVLGKPEESLMVKRIHAEEMPPHPRLTEVSVKPMDPEETKTLARWIELGAPIAQEEPDLAATANDPLVRPQDREFWSFQPPRASPIPQVAEAFRNQDSNRLHTPVDAFVAQKLFEKGLTFSNPAERLVLLRRVSFDLTGLPPTPSEAQEFLQDAAPDAYERVVDRLLASPRYGERWGRHWLDVAGYSDCEGRREQHLPRPFAWRYRDYVIRSLNVDKPYDRFLLEQIAGDELADYEHATTVTQELEDNLVATAFLRLAPDPTWANLTGFVPDRLEVTADSIDVLGSGIMGLTFKCARCHTHKFDPIPQRDYYRLVALFKGAYDEHDWLKPQLKNYGGALSAGMGERFLSQVTSAERQKWEEHQASIQRQLDALNAQPKTPELDKQIQSLESQKQPEPRIMALWDRGEPSPTYMYRRGNYATPGSLVSPGVPAVLSNPDKRFEIASPRPGATSTGRRLAFAHWLVDPEQPLTARVMVNRIWKYHFGQGIVHSLGNFGKMGDRPTHPELLDQLAIDFIRRGWSMKSLHRQLVVSTTYRQESLVSEKTKTIDSANWLLSRMPLQRLDAEELRDTILMVADELNDTCGGPAEPVRVRGDGLVLTGLRRSIYVEQLRKHPPSLLESFDLPAMNPNCLQRTDSLVPTQALHLWNDEAIRQLARQLADRALRDVERQKETAGAGSADTQQIEQVYRIVLGRVPDPNELTTCVESLAQLKAGWRNQPKAAGDASPNEATRRALATLCHTILNSAEFLYID